MNPLIFTYFRPVVGQNNSGFLVRRPDRPFFSGLIEECLEQGGTLRILLVDPSGSAIKMVEMRSPDDNSIEQERDRIVNTIEFIRQIKRRLPKADIQLRIIDYLPPYGITVTRNMEPSKSWCQVRLITYRSSVFKSPTLVPDPITDEDWFEFFSSQFDSFFESGKIVHLDP